MECWYKKTGRDGSLPVYFNDMDLIGIPIRITVGKKVNEGMIELKLRTENENQLYKIEEVE